MLNKIHTYVTNIVPTFMLIAGTLFSFNGFHAEALDAYAAGILICVLPSTKD